MKILVTGGASGLGEAITRRLCRDTDNFVLFTYCKSEAKAVEIQKAFSNSIAVHADFSDETSLGGLLKKISESEPDVLINNALQGFTLNHFHKIEPKIFSESFQKNVMPVVRITQEAIRVFRKRKSGKIITILSAGMVNSPPVGWSEYTANKAYLFSLAKSWAVENAGLNIMSNCISPALMETNLYSGTNQRIVELAKAGAAGKILTVEEVSNAVYVLVNASQDINGINQVINSGADVI